MMGKFLRTASLVLVFDGRERKKTRAEQTLVHDLTDHQTNYQPSLTNQPMDDSTYLGKGKMI